MPAALRRPGGHPVRGHHQRRPQLAVRRTVHPDHPAGAVAQRPGHPDAAAQLHARRQAVGQHPLQAGVVGAQDLPVVAGQAAIVQRQQRLAVRIADGQPIHRTGAGGQQRFQRAPTVQQPGGLRLQDLALGDGARLLLPIQHQHPQPEPAERPGNRQPAGSGTGHEDVGVGHRITASSDVAAPVRWAADR